MRSRLKKIVIAAVLVAVVTAGVITPEDYSARGLPTEKHQKRCLGPTNIHPTPAKVGLTLALAQATNTPVATARKSAEDATSLAPTKNADRKILEMKNAIQITDVPPGKFRDELFALPEPARERALAHLEQLDPPANDCGSLHSDENGDIFYACEGLIPKMQEAAPDAREIALAAEFTGYVPIGAPPVKHSRPGAPSTLLLDFKGKTVSGTIWLSGETRVCVPFDSDGDKTTFSPAEQAAIVRIWEMVSEDYSPWRAPRELVRVI